MDKFLLVTIDAKADSMGSWGIRLPFEFRSVQEGIGERLMPRDLLLSERLEYRLPCMDQTLQTAIPSK